MKVLLPIVLLGGMVAGCAGFLSSTLTRKPIPIIIQRSSPTLWAYNADGTMGDSIGIAGFHAGDTVVAAGYRYRSSPYYMHYLVVINGDTSFIRGSEVQGFSVVERDAISLDAAIAKSLKGGQRFRLSRTEDESAWARAVVWISKNATMKVEISSASLIQTYNPIKDGDRGYRVTRVPVGDSVEYEITCLAGSAIASNWCRWQDCAFYMKTGR